MISTSTSPGLGPPISMVSTVRGAPAFHATAALVFMIHSLKHFAMCRDRQDPAKTRRTYEPEQMSVLA
jgi:hypothetical protein